MVLTSCLALTLWDKWPVLVLYNSMFYIGTSLHIRVENADWIPLRVSNLSESRQPV